MELQQNSKALIFRQIAIDIKTAICNLTEKTFEGIFLKTGFVLYNRVLFDDFLRNLFCRFVLNQIYGGDFAKFCGLLRMTPKIMKHNRYFFPFQAFYVFRSGTG